MRRFTFILLVLAGCGGQELITTRQHAVTVEPGQVFRVDINEHKALDEDVLPKLGALPDGFHLQNQQGRSVIFRASVFPGTYTIPYRFVAERDGKTIDVSVEGQITVVVKTIETLEGIICAGSIVQLSLNSVHNEEAMTYGTNGAVTGIEGSPVTATVRRKNSAGDYRPGAALSVTFIDGGITALGSVSDADWTLFPILEFDVETVDGMASTDPADDWSCELY